MSEIEIGSIVFDNWKVVKLLGRGSFGAVYKIERKKSYESTMGTQSQFAALKVIYIPQSQQEVKKLRNMGMDHMSVTTYFKESTARICREIDVMDPLKGHGNIVSYDDYDIIPQNDGVGSVILIKMELLTAINDYAFENPMNEERTIQLGIDLCQALEACEKLNIIHRDIKPDNIFVNRFGSFKLGDFGIARTADGTTTATMTGTYGYMAPEVYNGEKYNATVDIYSLGIVLYQYLNGGRLPFMPPSGQKLAVRDFELASYKRLSGEIIPQIAGVDKRLSDIICKACAYNSKDRYQSAVEMKKALLDYQHSSEQNKGPERFIPKSEPCPESAKKEFSYKPVKPEFSPKPAKPEISAEHANPKYTEQPARPKIPERSETLGATVLLERNPSPIRENTYDTRTAGVESVPEPDEKTIEDMTKTVSIFINPDEPMDKTVGPEPHWEKRMPPEHKETEKEETEPKEPEPKEPEQKQPEEKRPEKKEPEKKQPEIKRKGNKIKILCILAVIIVIIVAKVVIQSMQETPAEHRRNRGDQSQLESTTTAETPVAAARSERGTQGQSESTTTAEATGYNLGIVYPTNDTANNWIYVDSQKLIKGDITSVSVNGNFSLDELAELTFSSSDSNVVFFNPNDWTITAV